MTLQREPDEAVDQELRRHLSDRELVELAVTVAAANFSNRLTTSLGLGSR